MNNSKAKIQSQMLNSNMSTYVHKSYKSMKTFANGDRVGLLIGDF